MHFLCEPLVKLTCECALDFEALDLLPSHFVRDGTNSSLPFNFFRENEYQHPRLTHWSSSSSSERVPQIGFEFKGVATPKDSFSGHSISEKRRQSQLQPIFRPEDMPIRDVSKSRDERGIPELWPKSSSARLEGGVGLTISPPSITFQPLLSIASRKRCCSHALSQGFQSPSRKRKRGSSFKEIVPPYTLDASQCIQDMRTQKAGHITSPSSSLPASPAKRSRPTYN